MADDIYGNETLRERLIIAGIDEISRRGIADFSLRRVASACNTSCAAPYKHFKNKEDMILSIITFINDKWVMFRRGIAEMYEGNPRKQLIEISIAYIRFWIANPNYLSALYKSGNAVEDREGMSEIIGAYCREKGLSADEWREKELFLRAFLNGAVNMLDRYEIENNGQTFSDIRKIIEREIK